MVPVKKSPLSAKLLKQLRQDQLNLSREALARRLESSAMSINRWESGQRIAGKYLSKLAELSRESGFTEAEMEFSRLRQLEIQRSTGDLRSTLRIPRWEVEQWREILSYLNRKLAEPDIEINLIRTQLLQLDNSMKLWAPKADDAPEFEQ